VLVLVLDLASAEGHTAEHQRRVLLHELGRYRPELLERPRLVVGNKVDIATEELAAADDALLVSAATRVGLDELLGRIGTLVGTARAEEPEVEPFVVLRPVEDGFGVVRDPDGGWRVTGRSAERVVAMADLTNPEAIEYVHQRLRRMGVERALARAGAREGDLVRLGPVELEYVEGF
jgi:GTP-binding protein